MSHRHGEEQATEPEHLDPSAVEIHPIHSDCRWREHPLVHAGTLLIAVVAAAILLV